MSLSFANERGGKPQITPMQDEWLTRTIAEINARCGAPVDEVTRLVREARKHHREAWKLEAGLAPVEWAGAVAKWAPQLRLQAARLMAAARCCKAAREITATAAMHVAILNKPIEEMA